MQAALALVIADALAETFVPTTLHGMGNTAGAPKGVAVLLHAISGAKKNSCAACVPQ